MADTNGTAALLASLTPLATPFEQALLNGGDRASDPAIQAERNNFNSLNGSGATQPDLTNQAPESITDFLFGSPTERSKSKVATMKGASPVRGFVILALIGLAVYFVLKKL